MRPDASELLCLEDIKQSTCSAAAEECRSAFKMQDLRFLLLMIIGNLLWMFMNSILTIRFFSEDLADEKVQKKIKVFKPNVIIGGPPCQDFSSAGHRDENLGRAVLTYTYRDIIPSDKTEVFCNGKCTGDNKERNP